MKRDMDLTPSWVYNMADYYQMFDLSDADLTQNILDYPAGISSFNMEMFAKGFKVCSGDSIYDLSLKEMSQYAEQLFKVNERYLDEHAEILRQNDKKTIDEILADWQKSKTVFLQDYEKGKKEGRYQFMTLPRFPFENYHFDIALCSAHLFHTAAMKNGSREALVEELCRVAKEVRVFPLLDETGKITDALGHVMLTFQQRNYGIKISEVPYHQMKGGNAMLKIWSTECIVD